MKKWNLFVLFCFAWCMVCAQERLIVKGKTPALYVEHTVAPKESLSSLGRRYGLTASRLAKFNDRSPVSLLSNGSTIKIPLSENNLLQTAQAAGNIPVYHIAGKGDNLFRISQQYYKVNQALLRKWNHSTGAVKNGQPVIIGYVKGSGNPGQDPDAATAKAPETEADKTPVDHLLTVKSTTGTSQEAVLRKEEPKLVQPVLTENANQKQQTQTGNNVSLQGDEGFFATLYAQQDIALKQQFRSGDAAIFKTVSGWTDKKYYVLINDITPGTIVRITASNNKSICARVLAPLPGTKGADTLLLRLSNSGAAALEMAGMQFSVRVTYFE